MLGEVAAAVSVVSSVWRSADDVQKKWVTTKSLAKGKASSVRRECGATGGGSYREFLTPAEERIVGVMGEVCVTGVAGGVDTSALTGFAWYYCNFKIL